MIILKVKKNEWDWHNFRISSMPMYIEIPDQGENNLILDWNEIDLLVNAFQIANECVSVHFFKEKLTLEANGLSANWAHRCIK